MKRTLLLIVFVAFANMLNAQFETAKQVYNSPKLNEVIATHKTLAILSYKVSIHYKRLPKNFDLTASAQKKKSWRQ